MTSLKVQQARQLNERYSNLDGKLVPAKSSQLRSVECLVGVASAAAEQSSERWKPYNQEIPITHYSTRGNDTCCCLLPLNIGFLDLKTRSCMMKHIVLTLSDSVLEKTACGFSEHSRLKLSISLLRTSRALSFSLGPKAEHRTAEP